MLEYVCNSNPQEAEAGGSIQCFLQAVLWVRSQLGLHETLSGVRACGGFGVAEAKEKDISEEGQGLSYRARQVTIQPCGLLWTLYWTQGRVGISLGHESWHSSKTEQTVFFPGRPHPYLHQRRNSWMRQRHPREVYYRAKAQVVNTGFSGVVGWNFRWLVLFFCFVLDLFTLFYVSECFCLSVCLCTICLVPLEVRRGI